MKNIGIILLAAGGSSRLGKPKQLLVYRGKTLLRRAGEAACDCGADSVVVVLGDRISLLADELRGLSLHAVENPKWKSGMGSSIRTGLSAISDRASELNAVMITLCDQPHVTGDVLRELMGAHAETDEAITATAYAGTLGPPAIFGRGHFHRLAGLADLEGAKRLLMESRETVKAFPLPLAGIDIDTLADYKSLTDSE